MASFVALATANARNALRATRGGGGGATGAGGRGRFYARGGGGGGAKGAGSRAKFYAWGWRDLHHPLPCAKGRIVFGLWHEVKHLMLLPCRPRFRKFASIAEAAQHEDFRHMVPFEADATVRGMPGAAEWTKPLSSREERFEQQAPQVAATHLRATASATPRGQGGDHHHHDARSVSSTQTCPPAVRKRRRLVSSAGAPPRELVPVHDPHATTRWRLDRPLEPVAASGRDGRLGDVPTTLHVATDGSVLDMNGAREACGGIGVAWQWGELEATQGTFQKPMPWNNDGHLLGTAHTNISAEWAAVGEAMTMVALKLSQTSATAGSDVRRHLHVRFYIDCRAVLNWLQAFAARLPLPEAPSLVPRHETNWVLKSRASMLLATHLQPNLASVSFHWVRAHQSHKAILALGGDARLAAQLNSAADQAAKTAASLYRNTFCNMARWPPVEMA